MTAGDKQWTIQKAMNSYLESEQATNAYPGISTHSQTEKITAL